MPYDKRYKPSERTLRQTWKAISDNPRTTMEDIATHTRHSKSTISRALDELQRRGVLTRNAKTARSVVIIEPFSWFDAS